MALQRCCCTEILRREAVHLYALALWVGYSLFAVVLHVSSPRGRGNTRVFKLDGEDTRPASATVMDATTRLYCRNPSTHALRTTRTLQQMLYR